MTLIQRLSVSATIRNIIIFYLVMKKNKEDLDLADIFTHETTLRALSEVYPILQVASGKKITIKSGTSFGITNILY